MLEKLITLIESMRWQDGVDIAISSYILYRFYVLFEGTTVFRVLMGLVLLWLFKSISVNLGLVVTSWAIQAITAAAAIIVIVVFRNEIRSVLQATNMRAVLWGASSRPLGRTPVGVLADAVFEMAKKRIGALIVFPGKEDLSELAQNGVRLSAELSRELIVSVFFKDNPLHDGAAIVKDGRLVTAGAILPLTRREDLPSHYGTRHRAAAGLTESSDALVVLISEERGSIALSKDGGITPVYYRQELEQTLRRHLGEEDPKGRRAMRKRIKMAAAAVIAVGFITGVWFSFTRALDTLASYEVPIEFLNRETEMAILKVSDNTARIQVNGSAALIRSMRPDQIKVKVDLLGAAVGVNRFPVTEANVTLPPGIVLTRIEPQLVSVTVDKEAIRLIPVQVDWAGRLSEDRILKTATWEPESLKITGSSLVVKNVDRIYTKKVILDPLKESGSLTVRPIIRPSSVRLADGEKNKITVSYVIEPREKKVGASSP